MPNPPPRPTVVCLTPVKNEAWILERFLRCALLWADHVIVADQGSTDGSAELARGFDRVTVVENPEASFDEPGRQRFLIEEARRIPGPRVLVALDADEVLSAEVLETPAWGEALRQPPGTVLRFPRAELGGTPASFVRRSDEDDTWFPLGYVDDGAPHVGRTIHSCRVPNPPGAPQHRVPDVMVLHYQLCEPGRMESKHRWYRCYERVTFPGRSPVEIERQYSWMRNAEARARPSPPSWFAGYEARGIDMTTIQVDAPYWWDWEVLRMFARHGPTSFHALDVWTPDWDAVLREGHARGVEDLPATPPRPLPPLRKRLALELLRAVPPGRRGRVAEWAAGLLLR